MAPHVLAARAMVPLRPAPAVVLAHHLHRPRNVSASVWSWLSIRIDNQRIVPQVPTQMTRKRLRPAAAGRSQARINTDMVRTVNAAISASIERCARSAALLKFSPSRRRRRSAAEWEGVVSSPSDGLLAAMDCGDLPANVQDRSASDVRKYLQIQDCVHICL